MSSRSRGRSSSTTRRIRASTKVVHRYTDPDTGRTEVFKPGTRTFALWSRKVCGPGCNSGWLRELEERVRPVMAAFAGRVPVVLSPEQQANLALWASAAALVAMSMEDAASDFADPALAREMHVRRCAPAGMEVWLGTNAHGEMGWFGSHSLTLPGPAGKTDAWGASITFGYAVFHIVFHGLPEQRLRLRGSAHRALRRIWATQDRVEWPSTSLLINPMDLTPLATIVSTESSFERSCPRGALRRRRQAARGASGGR